MIYLAFATKFVMYLLLQNTGIFYIDTEMHWHILKCIFIGNRYLGRKYYRVKDKSLQYQISQFERAKIEIITQSIDAQIKRSLH